MIKNINRIVFFILLSTAYLFNFSCQIEDNTASTSVVVTKPQSSASGTSSSTSGSSGSSSSGSTSNSSSNTTDSDSFDPTISLLGNPSKATTDSSASDYKTNYLLQKAQYCLSYNDETHIPNWVAWHLDSDDLGSVTRYDKRVDASIAFHGETGLPDSFYKVLHSDYTGSGFSRGHMCPSGDRTDLEENNNETFSMANMVPQNQTNNDSIWGNMEDYERYLAKAGNELYIFAGPYGKGGVTSDGSTTKETYTSKAGTVTITVPAKVWKIILVLDKGDNDLARIDANTRVIASIQTNDSSSTKWSATRVSVDEIEALTGYDFFANLSDDIENTIEAKVDTVSIPSSYQ